MTVTAAPGLERLDTKPDDALVSLPVMDDAAILARAAELQENPVKDKSYRLTPLGRLVGLYLDEIIFNGYSLETIRSREGTLAYLSFRFANRDPASITTDELRAYTHSEWGELARNTKNVYVSCVKVFFAWAHDNDHIPHDPARKLRSVRQEETTRRAHPAATVRQLVVSQPALRDRCGLLALYWCALRRNELRQVQFRHVDLTNRILLVFGKGGTILEQNIPEPLELALKEHMLVRDPKPAEYLLYPQKVGRWGTYPLYSEDVIWENRMAPLSIPGIDKWWRRAVERSGLPHFPMHEMRHTAGTDFHRQGGDLIATQHFLRHKNPATTAKTYVHLDRVRTVSEVQRRMADPMDGD